MVICFSPFQTCQAFLHGRNPTKRVNENNGLNDLWGIWRSLAQRLLENLRRDQNPTLEEPTLLRGDDQGVPGSAPREGLSPQNSFPPGQAAFGLSAVRPRLQAERAIRRIPRRALERASGDLSVAAEETVDE